MVHYKYGVMDREQVCGVGEGRETPSERSRLRQPAALPLGAVDVCTALLWY